MKRWTRGLFLLGIAGLIMTTQSATAWRVEAAEPTETMLIDAESLAKQLQADGQPAVIDVRSRNDYQAGHIPQARWVDIDLWRSKSFEPTGMTDTEEWSRRLGELGLQADQTIVVAGDSLPNAARAWWLLSYLGMEDVRLLDGGYAAWREAGLDLVQDEPQFATTRPKIELQPQRLAGLSDLSPEERQRTECKVVDTRSEAEFTGQRALGPRGGHVPGAVHLEWTRFVGSNGKFLPPAEIRQLIEQQGLELQDPLVTHCQSGGRSSVAAFALELAGAEDVKNYYRGWSEYAGELTAPVEK